MTKRRTRRGWKKVEEYRHDMSGVKAGIYLNTGTSEFDVEIDNQVFRSSSLNDLRDQIHNYLDQRAKVEWQDIIRMELHSGYGWRRDTAMLGFDMERFLVSGLMFNEKHLHTEPRTGDSDTSEARMRDAKPLSWNVKELGELKPPCSNNEDVFYLPYSDATWKALEELQERIRKAQENLSDILLEPCEPLRLKALSRFLSKEGKSI